jgi:UDP-N-acetylmuramate: L-alanyl-gamma-D-glutamyl-meso-diaminopimelate ligase
MHAMKDNPELIKAKKLGLPIYSFPEYIRKQSDDKQRIIIAGSHGKTTITAMIMHVLKYSNRDFDYVVGAHLDGFNNIVKLSDAPIIIMEGDEYFSSAHGQNTKIPKV